ncbi:hypothetical protein HDU84_003057 [Entophlyctis sp. JEL0112]|nr:hypothetical protein HDU84_003057 [Entophlyctis sp. JEL0112]
MSTADRDRRRRMSSALGAARSPSVSRAVYASPPTSPPPPPPQSFRPVGADNEVPRSGPRPRAAATATPSSSASDSDSDGVASADTERAVRAARRRQARTLSRIIRNAGWDEGLASLVAGEVELSSLPASSEGIPLTGTGNAADVAKDANDGGLKSPNDAHSPVNNERRSHSVGRDIRSRRTSAIPVSTSRKSVLEAEPARMVNEPLSLPIDSATQHEPNTIPDHKTKSNQPVEEIEYVAPTNKGGRRESSRFGTRRISMSAKMDPSLSVDSSETSRNIDDDGGIRQRARDRIRGKSIDFKGSQLLTSSAGDITSAYDSRLRQIVLESLTAVETAKKNQAATSEVMEFVPLKDDDDEIPYVHPAASRSRIPSASSIRMVRKRSSVSGQIYAKQMSDESTDAARKSSSESIRPIDSNEDDGDVPYVAPTSTVGRKQSSASIRMVRKRASVLQSAILQPTEHLNAALATTEGKIEGENSLADKNTSIDTQKTRTVESSLDYADIEAIEEEFRLAGHIDPETGKLLRDAKVLTENDIVVSASGIKKDPVYTAPSIKASRAASTPHLKLTPTETGEKFKSKIPVPAGQDKRKSTNSSEMHPTLSLPRPPKPHRHSALDSWPPPAPPSKHVSSPLTKRTATGSGPDSQTQTPAPPRIRRESSIGIAAAAASSAASSAFSYLSKVASSYLEQHSADGTQASAAGAATTTFVIANDADALDQPSELPGRKGSTLASALAYFTGPVTPKPVVEPPQLYGQTRAPIRNASTSSNAASASGSRASMDGGLGSVVEDWWKKGFGAKKE